jgi:hypothetical protein
MEQFASEEPRCGLGAWSRTEDIALAECESQKIVCLRNDKEEIYLQLKFHCNILE